MFIQDDVDAFFMNEWGWGLLEGGHVGGEFVILDEGKSLFAASVNKMHGYIEKCFISGYAFCGIAGLQRS